MFTCDRCGYTTESKFCLHQHYSRKNPCPALRSLTAIADLIERDFPATITAYMCDKCGNCFASAQSKWNHAQRCKIGATFDEYLVPFGEEKIEVDCDEFKTILLEYMKLAAEPIDLGMYIKYKFFDSTRPENHTLRKQRRADKHIEYYDGSVWRHDTFPNIVEKIMRMFEQEVIAMFEGFSGRDRYLRRDGERYMFLFRFMMNVGFPFRFMQLAALVDECNTDDMNYDMASQTEFRDGTINLIPTVIYQLTKELRQTNRI